MPLSHGKSKKAFEHNIKAEIGAGKPKDQALAIAYAVKRKAAHKMAQGGAVSAANEKRPSTQETDNDKHDIAQNSTKKPLTESNWTDRPELKQSAKGMKTTAIKHPKMVPSSAYSTKLRTQEDHLEEAAKVNNGPQEQPAKWMDEKDAKKKGPDAPALHMKKMAEGGEINKAVSMKRAEEDEVEHPAGLESDNDSMKPSDEEIMADHMEMLADGGEISPDPEEEIEKHASIAAAIMAKRRMANGGVIDRLDPEHEDDKDLEPGQVDIDDNGREMPNPMDKRNHKILSDNLDEDLMDVEQPEDSNEHGRQIESDKHDLVSRIRAKLSKKSPISK